MKILSPVLLAAFAVIFVNKSLDVNAGAASSSEVQEISLDYHLPHETHPEHYNIILTTNTESAFQGEVAIDIVVVTPTNNIVLHARELIISQAKVINSITGEAEELSYTYELKREFLTLMYHSGKNFEAGTAYKIVISYNGVLRDDNQGFFRVKYADEYGVDRYVTLTQLEGGNARYVFPCYDEPAKRATFTITINHNPALTALSNMPVNEISSSPGKTVFLKTPSIPTHFVALVLGDFEYTELTFGGIRQRVYSRSSKKSYHQFCLTNGMFYVNYFAKYYGINYMLPKLDHVAIKDLDTDAMERWGLIIYSERNSLYNDDTSPTTSKFTIAKYVAHEVAHQWFGNRWFTYLWLKEGLANLLSYRAMEHVFPEWNVWQHFHAVEYLQAMDNDAYANSSPMTYYVEKMSEIDKIYDNISDIKVTAVLLMWQNVLGEEVFQHAVQNFRNKNQYREVKADNFFSDLGFATDNLELPASITEMMATWINQGGFPILTVTRNYYDGSFIVKQETFFKNADLSDTKTWYIPINFATASNPDFSNTKASHYLPNINEILIDAQLNSHDWIILNKRSEYFYRIKYDEYNYGLIIATLKEDHFRIHSRNRAQLLQDASVLSFSNRLKHGILLDMMTYLRKEDQHAPWIVASDIISQYKYLKDYPEFKNFVAELVLPIFKKLGLHAIPGEHHTDQYIRKNIIGIACKAAISVCLVETNKELKAHLIEKVIVEPDLKDIIFSYGLMEAGDEEFDIVYQKLMEETDQNKRSLLMDYLSSAQNEIHIKKFISSSIDTSNKLLPAERHSIISKVYVKSEVSLLACIEFLSENWNSYEHLLIDENNPKPIDNDIRGMAEYVFNKRVEDEFLALVEKVKNSQHVSTSLESDIKNKIYWNYQWLQAYGEPILKWITQHMSN